MSKPKISQVIPGSRILPPLKPTTDDDKQQRANIGDKLSEIATRSYWAARPESEEEAWRASLNKADTFVQAKPLAAILALGRAEMAASHFVSEKADSQPIHAFRKGLSGKGKKSLKAAVEALNAHLTSSSIPPFQQMQNLYCYDDPEANGLGDEDDPRVIAQQFRRKHLWERRYSPEALSTTLAIWLKLIGDLRERAGNSKSTVAAEKGFVNKLAFYWRHELKAELSDSRGIRAGDTSGRQKGPFVDFVMTAVEIIPHEYRAHVRWDHAIRQCVGRSKARALNKGVF